MADFVYDTGYGTLDTGLGKTVYANGATLVDPKLEYLYVASVTVDPAKKDEAIYKHAADLPSGYLREIPLLDLPEEWYARGLKQGVRREFRRNPDFVAIANFQGRTTLTLAWK